MSDLNTLTRIYLGRNVPSGAVVCDGAIELFLRDTVSGCFPGFTVIDAVGYWKGERERTTIVEILHGETHEDRTKLIFIAETYGHRFEQESVLSTSIYASTQLIETNAQLIERPTALSAKLDAFERDALPRKA